ncbi:FkbM family methyltransferase [Hymenobacter sp. BT188]|uniref:FkbM family methyltransferase n=1 Tax=Hymenobacter sp. BT188 TaxID=2763504 RepID=UPI0016510230|nr:FkbM family methyltransferase [Hymenobacter sp. BT188]MBC6607159.1 FkbM family methyltransferase [Hymenobacter sp. BT188]
MTNIKSILHKQTLVRFKYSKSVRFTGVTFDEYCAYAYRDFGGGEHIRQSVLFGKTIKRNNTFWFVQNIEEVFVDEVYKFNSKSKSPLILDCGSNIGLSLIYFKRNHPNAKIIGFEPDSVIYAACKDNLNSFDYNDVEVVNAAIWKQDGFISFLPDNCLGGKIVEDINDPSISKVKSVRLKNYLNQKVDFLKIDIEGAELDVLLDCKDELSMVDNLFVEYHSKGNRPQDLQELLIIITDAGFRYYIESAWKTMSHPYVDHFKHDPSFYDLQLNIFAYRN